MSATDRATFAARWRQAVAAAGERPFLRWEDADGRVTDWTYEEFDRLVSIVAGKLVACGVRPGASVHLALANSPAFVSVWLAATLLGVRMIPSDPKATVRELRGHISRTGPTVGICAVERADVYREAAVGGPEVLVVDEPDPEVNALRASPANWSDIGHPQPRDPAAIMFTSGTTSEPKGVEVTQANYAFAGDVMASAAALSRFDCQLVVLPMFHANAQYYSFASAISVGASVALMHTFSATRFLEQATRHEASHASLFAAPMRMILARGAVPVEGIRLEHLWYAQNVTEEQYEQLGRLFGCRPRQLYGMTETIPAVLTNRALAPIPDSMGIPTLGCQVDLKGQESSEPVPAGEVGEVVVRGTPGTTLFAGYLDDPSTTAASFRDGWFRTGDLARRDEQGNFYFEGRRSDVLKVSGENVSVVEVEAVLAQHTSVLEAAVVGEPDPVRDEVPIAYVVQQPGKPLLDLDEVGAWCSERLSPAKRPRRIELIEELPRTSVGKIRKFMLGRAARTARSEEAEVR